MTVPIEYTEVLTLILVVFGMVGMMRGWYREGVTSFFVVFLAILLWRPEIGNSIIEWINGFLRFILSFFKAGLTFNTAKLSAASAEVGNVLDPTSYQLWIIITVVLIGISYAVGEATFDGPMSALGRLLGGVIGAANGYVIFSMVKQFLANDWGVRTGVSASSVGEVAIQMTNVPADSFVSGYGIVFVLVLLIAVVGLLIAADKLKIPLK
jgi:hypothetical protein